MAYFWKTSLVIASLVIFFDNGIMTTALSATPREPSIQAYGLPKRFLSNNGYIERVNLGIADEESDRINAHPGDPSGIRKKFESKIGKSTKDEAKDDGTIEILHLGSKSGSRLRRRVDDDMNMEETKVFRPLFVYRQQLARREKAQQHPKNVRKYDPGYQKKNSINHPRRY